MLGTTFTLGIGTFDRSGGAPESNRGSLYSDFLTWSRSNLSQSGVGIEWRLDSDFISDSRCAWPAQKLFLG
jgi:hypothetical protein